MNISFDENDDLVLEDIPDDLVELSAKIADDRGLSVEDVWRDILIKWSNEPDF